MTVLIAASDATIKERQDADYQCDGTNDHSEINIALSVGNNIRLSSGNFNLADSVSVLGDIPKKLSGSGFGVTLLNFAPASEKSAIIIGDESFGYGRKHQLRDFALIGKNANADIGIHLVYGASWNVFDNIWVEGFVRGVVSTTDSSQNRFTYIQTRDCSNYGFQVFGAGNNFYFCEASKETVGNMSGFRIQGSGNSFHGCIVHGYTFGFDLADYAEGVSLYGPYTDSCKVGIKIQGSYAYHPKQVNVFGGFVYGCNEATLAAIVLRRSKGVNIIGVSVKNSQSNKSLSADANVEECYLVNNLLLDSTPMDINPAADVKVL